MQVIPGEPFRFLVQSESRPGVWFMVDLEAYSGRGRCECEHWQIRKGSYLGEGLNPWQKQCKHLQKARLMFMMMRMPIWSAEQEGRRNVITKIIEAQEAVQRPETPMAQKQYGLREVPAQGARGSASQMRPARTPADVRRIVDPALRKVPQVGPRKSGSRPKGGTAG